jgi:putative endopeptidase
LENSSRLFRNVPLFFPHPQFPVHIDPGLATDENIADLGGLWIALGRYHASLHGKPAPVVNGWSGDQKLFMSFAHAFRAKARRQSGKKLS